MRSAWENQISGLFQTELLTCNIWLRHQKLPSSSHIQSFIWFFYFIFICLFFRFNVQKHLIKIQIYDLFYDSLRYKFSFLANNRKVMNVGNTSLAPGVPWARVEGDAGTYIRRRRQWMLRVQLPAEVQVSHYHNELIYFIKSSNQIRCHGAVV